MSSHGPHCRFGHNPETQQNSRVLKAHSLDDLNVDELRLIFKLPFVKGVLALYGVSCDRKPREILEDLLMYMENEDTYDQKRSHLKWLGSDLSGAREVTGRIPQKGQICEFFLKVEEVLELYGVSLDRRPKLILEDLFMYMRDEEDGDQVPPEFQRVLNRFLKDLPRAKVKAIRRVQNRAIPRIYVVFRNQQIYPEYLIQYQR
nr:hypothetical protein BaRGS_007145 [Batillaria attramentaria]